MVRHYGSVKGRQYREKQPEPSYEQLGNRKCSKCGEIKPIKEFYTYLNKRGTRITRSTCKACDCEYNRLHDKRRKRG